MVHGSRLKVSIFFLALAELCQNHCPRYSQVHGYRRKLGTHEVKS